MIKESLQILERIRYSLCHRRPLRQALRRAGRIITISHPQHGSSAINTEENLTLILKSLREGARETRVSLNGSLMLSTDRQNERQRDRPG
ncbi:hypothetical protein PoB_002551500 [Plakobranchus ocellatus]|uniref:Uncharacterized protein n=1 Tax=Plakobranchus ocellatus TaxID=259542 RepID=A0AAV3ZWK9_9GAST|nr:hypothetical protein PoB_002551500 [Plakobranchus ocellatus]